MPVPTKAPVRVIPKRTIAPVTPGAETQPLTIEAAGEGAEKGSVAAPLATSISETVPAPVTVADVSDADVKAALQSMSSNPAFTENIDGSITIPLDFPVDVSVFGIPGVSIVDTITLQRATWKKRRAAAKRYIPNATTLDQDTALMAELSGLPEHVIDELDGRDISLVQMALGKLLYSPRLLSAI